MEFKEIIIMFFSVCVAVLSFPYAVKASNGVVDCLSDAVASAVNTYKEDWKNCIKTVKGWLFNGN